MVTWITNAKVQIISDTDKSIDKKIFLWHEVILLLIKIQSINYCVSVFRFYQFQTISQRIVRTIIEEDPHNLFTP